MSLYGALLPAQKNALRNEIVLIDIDRPEGQDDAEFRQQLADLLDVLSRQLLQPPKAVLLDIYFLPGNQAGLDKLIDSIAAFKRQHTTSKIYATVPRLDKKGLAALDEIRKGQGETARLYASLDGYGHTEFRQTFSGKVIYYVPYLAGIRDFVSTAYYDAEPTLSPHSDERIVRLGASLDTAVPSANLLRFSAAKGQAADLCAGFVAGKCITAGSIGRRDWIIIGSVKFDTQAWALSGPETVAWALHDLISPNQADRPQPIAAPWLLAALVLFSSLASWSVFLIFFRLWKTPPSKVWRVAALSFAVGCCVLLAVAGLFWMAGRIFPQMSVILLSVSLGTLIGWLHVRAVMDDALLPTGDATDIATYYDVFISYSHEPSNVAWVNEHIYQPLLALRKTDGQALRIFMDKSELSVGMLWFRKLAHSIQESAIFLPVYSLDYFERGYCLWESEVAQRKLIKLIKPNETAGTSFTIFPLRLEGVRVPAPYDGLQFETEARKLIQAMSNKLGLH